MTKDATIEGQCAPGFAKVKDAFYANFRDRGEVGASVAVVIDGNPVIDLWGGFRDRDREKPWESDTLVCVQSVTKEIVALALHMAIDRGLIDIDAPAARYWPEFAQAGKAAAKVRWLLDHRIGIPVVAGATPGMAYRYDDMITALAATEPLWEPGTTPCYHSANYGYLVGKLLQNVTGKSPGQFLREEIAVPLGLDCHIGLRSEARARVATFLNKENHPSQAWIDEGTNIFARSWKIFSDKEDFNSDGWLTAEIPSVNAHTNARALGRLCALMAAGGELDGVRLLGRSALARAGEKQWEGLDVQNRYLSMSLGFLLPHRHAPATGPRCLGFAGAGGATAFADPDRRLAFAYTMNSMDPDLSRPRPTALINALVSCL